MKKFKTNEELIYFLIVDDLEETISKENKTILDEWRKADRVNESTYQDFLNVQLNIDKLFNRNGFDLNLSWQSLEKKIENPVVTVPLEIKQGKSTRLWYKVAAAILLISGAGYYLMRSNEYTTVSTKDNTTISYVVLPDGTEVSLNTGTIIKYNKDNFNADRKLDLVQGEIFVHVIKHDGTRFRVILGDVEAQDIGTSFNLLKTDQKATVVVEEGKVSLKHTGNNVEVLLTAGKSGVYNTENRQLSSADNLDANYKAWMDKKFVFRGMPMSQVAAQLEKAYKIPLRIKGDALGSRKFTANIHYRTLDSVLAVISASLQCKITRVQNKYVLSEN